MNNSKILNNLQKLGKSLMVPIAVMPVVAIMLRLGVLWNMPAITAAGNAVFANLGLLFAIGVAIGYAKNSNGAAALAATVGYHTIDLVSKSINDKINMGVLGGIIAGLVASKLYNKFKDIKLPDFLGFFAGKRFVPIITSLACLLIGILSGYVWPTIQNGMDTVANWIVGAGPAGMFTFGTMNRLLIPTGLHHVLNSVVWFVFGEYNGATGDLGRFFAGDPNAGVFMAGFFPVMMFGLPAACLAMVLAAKRSKRKAVIGFFTSIAFTSFLTGITEPIEFAFMFIAPLLYVIHAILTGLSMAIVNSLGILHGFGFSAGAIDFGLNMHLATKGWLLVPIGIVFFVAYFLIFFFAIKKFNIQTPGREEGGILSDDKEYIKVSSNSDFDEIAKRYIQALGGKDNIVESDCCITRLRLTVKNVEKFDEIAMKKLGAQGIIKLNKTTAQIIIGTRVEQLFNAMTKFL